MSVLPVIPVRWDVTPAEARSAQAELVPAVRLCPLAHPPRLVAGADTSYDRGSNRVTGAVVVWDTRTEQLVERRTAVVETPFPYVPGLLAYREAPALMPAFAALSVQPDVIALNGHGIAHPRRIGLATHLGLVFGLPAIGIAQNLLCGNHGPVGPEPGDTAELTLNGAQVGYAVRTRARSNPIYVSPGHRITVADALGLILATTRGYKLPVMIREAHLLSNQVRRQAAASHIA
ncbi:MAG: endonuclease V [Leptospirillia bacterium]